MTDPQKHAITSLSRCTSHPGSWPKRFVRRMQDTLRYNPDRELTENQHSWLMKLLHAYRKQHGRCFCAECKRIEANAKAQLVLF